MTYKVINKIEANPRKMAAQGKQWIAAVGTPVVYSALLKILSTDDY